MKTLELWQQRLVQSLHDPVHKAMILGSGLSHGDEAKILSEALTGLRLRVYNYAPDWAATGADRPDLGPNKFARVDWRKFPLITHPLQPGVILDASFEGMPVGKGTRAKVRELTEKLAEHWKRFRDAAHEGAEEQGEEAGDADEQQVTTSVWNNEQEIRRLQLTFWRQLEIAAQLQLGVPSAWLPADSRCPDHGITNHLRFASALAFLDNPGRKRRRGEREPWLVQMGVRGVQEYIARSRKTRDFWTSCMIFSELVWAAMQEVIDIYGPESIVYPDLWGNPLMDQWLLDRADVAGAVPDWIAKSGAPTYAAPIPNTFMALLPRGGEGDLPKLEELADRCEGAVKRRWVELANEAKGFLVNKLGSGTWTQVWDRQLNENRAPTFVWSAVRWRRWLHGIGERPTDIKTLPGQPNGPVNELVARRRKALEPWLPPEVWAAYEHARDVFWATDTASSTKNRKVRYHSTERGMDYPLVHHQLRRTYVMRKAAETPKFLEEPGEKCALTGEDEVLSNSPVRTGGSRRIHQVRADARNFWKAEELGGAGEERLGGPGAMKRFLGYTRGTFCERWAGKKKCPSRPKVPFPSTASLAGARFVEAVVAWADKDTDLKGAVERFVQAVRQAEASGLLDGFTTHPDAHPRLSHLATRQDDVAAFARVEVEYLHEDTFLASIERLQTAGKQAEAAQLELVRDRAKELRKAARTLWDKHKDNPEAKPLRHLPKDVGVLFMDGDGMSKLLLGAPDTIQTRWRDVLHPKVVEHLEEQERTFQGDDEQVAKDTGKSQEELSAWRTAIHGWMGLLDSKRLMGPGLHPSITRSLARFVHEIAPWVVECEFDGRLVYSGGDDVLAMLPLADLIPAATRLQQLFSAPFVVDTRPEVAPWSWRRGEIDLSFDGRREMQRYRIPVIPEHGPFKLDSCRWEKHAGVGEEPDADFRFDPTEHELFPMLGRPHGISAGIAFGHFKTPLDRLIREGRDNLHEVAKRGPGGRKGALAVTRFTRSGSKGLFAAGWLLGSGSYHDGSWSPEPPTIASTVQRVAEAFAKKTLSDTLPYKLAQVLDVLGPEMFTGTGTKVSEDGRRFLEGWLRKQVQVDDDDRTLRACYHLAEAGIVGWGRQGKNPKQSSAVERDIWSREAVSGLLLARHLSRSLDMRNRDEAGGGEQ